MYWLRISVLLLLLCPLSICRGQSGGVYQLKSGKIAFLSYASQELIHASTTQLQGVIDPYKKTFAFKVNIISFSGFNNQLQQEHFNENYMETTVFPVSTYTGKIIEDVNLLQNGEYNIRTKGKLKIHGIEQERIIKSHIICKDGKATIRSDFSILLSDYNIKIPKIVNNKVSNNIDITVEAIFVRSS